MLPQSSEEALLFYEGLVAYAAARTSRRGAEQVLLRAMTERHAEIIMKLFRNAPEDHAEVENFFRECIRLVQSEPPVCKPFLPRATVTPRRNQRLPHTGDAAS
ncbi:hypothetical protein ASE36_20595 [Rhizobium sp. Root274]|nr:hypothetical protein ASC71_20640 [Rhizobium sp. Root1240]KRD26357.1 hypothetical protein ASE36_20595 [Rhizobium sp. Root274]